MFIKRIEKTKRKLRKYILKQIDKKKKKLKDDDNKFIHFSYKNSLNDLNDINDSNLKYKLKRFYKTKKSFSSTNVKKFNINTIKKIEKIKAHHTLIQLFVNISIIDKNQ